MSLSRCGSTRASGAKPVSCWHAIYGWFTEGFDTADLQEAKALLEQWGDTRRWVVF